MNDQWSAAQDARTGILSFLLFGGAHGIACSDDPHGRGRTFDEIVEWWLMGEQSLQEAIRTARLEVRKALESLRELGFVVEEVEQRSVVVSEQGVAGVARFAINHDRIKEIVEMVKDVESGGRHGSKRLHDQEHDQEQEEKEMKQ